MKVKFLVVLKNILLNQTFYSSIDAENVLAKQRFILFRIFSITGSLVSTGVFIKMCLMFETLNTAHYLVPALSFGMLANFYCIRKQEKLYSAYFIVLISAFILLHIVGYSTGGIRSASILYFPVIILYAFMLLGRKTGQFFTLLFCAQVIYMFLITRYTEWVSFDFLENKNSHIEEDFLFNGLFTFFLVATQSIYLHSGRNVVIKKITEQRDELAHNNILLSQYNLSLDKTNKELDKFAYVVSHDLKAPLRAIGNLAGWIKEDMNGMLTPEVENHLKTISARANRMEALINGILQYSKTSRQEEKKENINIKVLVKETVDLIGANDFCKVLIDESLPVLFTCRVKLQQVLLNLLDNAIKHCDKQPIEIVIKVSYQENDFHFSIKDNGPGIEQQFHERVFVIFQTLKPRDQFESTGVGLAIVKKIIDDAGGKISIESKPGNGTVFHFSLPVKRETEIFSTT